MYRLSLLSGPGTIAAVQRFYADTDAEALTMARDTLKRSFEVAGFELWEGRRKVGGESPRE
jgi:hypothetical protein